MPRTWKNSIKNFGQALSRTGRPVEVVYTVVKVKGMSKEELEQTRTAKAEKRHGFEWKIFLVGVEE
jgi:predicted house-cleaning noncanonical NTP pyrophosphatase (MazG superfamily)